MLLNTVFPHILSALQIQKRIVFTETVKGNTVIIELTFTHEINSIYQMVKIFDCPCCSNAIWWSKSIPGQQLYCYSDLAPHNWTPFGGHSQQRTVLRVSWLKIDFHLLIHVNRVVSRMSKYLKISNQSVFTPWLLNILSEFQKLTIQVLCTK